LNKGKAPYNIVFFYKEVSTGLDKILDAKDILVIADHFKLMYNNKLKEEKASKKGKKEKPNLNNAASKYTRNNNTDMIQDVMGGDDYGGYGEEDDKFEKEKEAEHDFM